MKRFLFNVATAAAFSCFGTAMIQAQTTAERDGKIQQRKENQQSRIANGVKTGSLTAGETAQLEHRESRLNKEVHHDRVANGGNLTNNEKKQINRQQNRLSGQIYNAKHNGAHQSK